MSCTRPYFCIASGSSQAAAGVALAGLLLVSLSAAAAASHFSAYASVASRIPVEFHRLSPDLARPPELADVDPQLLTNCPFVKGDSVERVKAYYGIA